MKFEMEETEYIYEPTRITIEAGENGATVWFENDLLDIGLYGKKSKVYVFEKEIGNLEGLKELLEDVEGALCGYTHKCDTKKIKIDVVENKK